MPLRPIDQVENKENLREQIPLCQPEPYVPSDIEVWGICKTPSLFKELKSRLLLVRNTLAERYGLPESEILREIDLNYMVFTCPNSTTEMEANFPYPVRGQFLIEVRRFLKDNELVKPTMYTAEPNFPRKRLVYN